MRPDTKYLPKCPFDACPMKPFARVKVSLGYTVALHGCRFCNFNHVIAIASDENGSTRMVAQWSFDVGSGLYVLAKEYGTNPPDWLEFTCAALPQGEQT
jgi:hypothetical protein